MIQYSLWQDKNIHSHNEDKIENMLVPLLIYEQYEIFNSIKFTFVRRGRHPVLFFFSKIYKRLN